MADEFTRRKLQAVDRLMYDYRLNPTERLVGFDIYSRLNRVTGDAWPSQETIASALRLSARTVRRAIDRLKDLDYIRVKFDGRVNRYTPRLISGAIGHQCPVDEDSNVRSARTPASPNHLHTTPSPTSPQRRAVDNPTPFRGGMAVERAKREGQQSLHKQFGERKIELMLIEALGEPTYERIARDNQLLLRLFQVFESNGGRLTASDIAAVRQAVSA